MHHTDGALVHLAQRDVSFAAVSRAPWGKMVVWHVSGSQLNFVKDKNEWTGTEIVFEINQKGSKTELRFTHVGLVPAFECYGGCSGAWGFLSATVCAA